MIRVMIVAKHAEVREDLIMVLRLAGSIEVCGAVSSISSAIRLACAEHPDVALIDLEMPGGEGYEAIRQLRHACPALRTMALTAHDYPAAREKAIQSGANRVMVKGMDLPDMISAILAAAGE